ncbi:hypothetical protein GCM10010246_81050 [Streptomyces cuspidosporus]|uniref:Uncharacterized protein n=1 Tax=Streptomyces cuspidosporus TaxID=66882 RepID=A0ABN3HAG1_9ACTN
MRLGALRDRGQGLLTLLGPIVRILARMMALWPFHPPRGRHRRGAPAPVGRPLPGAVRGQPTPEVRRSHVPSGQARRDTGQTEWVDTGPLVRAYVVLHEERQHALSLRLGMGGQATGLKGATP